MGLEKPPPKSFADLKERNYTLYTPLIEVADFIDEDDANMYEKYLRSTIREDERLIFLHLIKIFNYFKFPDRMCSH